MKLTVVIPVFNAYSFLNIGYQKLLPLYGLLKRNEFEIIYVNDGSTDNSEEILNDIERQQSNIKIIHQENQGSSGARNSAIEIAKGEYIQFLDSDDFIDWEIVISLLNLANKESIDIIGYRINNLDDKFNLIKQIPKHQVTYDKIISGKQALISGYNPSKICPFLFKLSFLNNHNLRIYPRITHMDIEFMSRALMYTESVYFSELFAYFYITRKGSITNPTNKKRLEKLLFDEVIVANLVKNNIYKCNQNESSLQKAIQKNYNSVVWNLLWRFFRYPKEVDRSFKLSCLKELKDQQLYPIQGPLKTPFQNFSRYFFNLERLLKLSWKR